MPTELQHTKSPVDKKNEALVKKYGSDNWYDWSIHNWGTKWNACEADVKLRRNQIYLSFSTAWSPPLPVLYAWATKYPALTFELRYYEGGMGFKGKIKLHNGEVIDDKHTDYRGRRGG